MTKERTIAYPPDAVLTAPEVAAALNVDESAVALARVRRIYIGHRTVRYFWRDVEAARDEIMDRAAVRLARTEYVAPALPPVPEVTERSVLYVLRNPVTGHLKIGITNDLAERVRALTYASGIALEVVFARGGTRRQVAADEARWHTAFAADRTIGEWFRPSPELVAFIEQEVRRA